MAGGTKKDLVERFSKLTKEEMRRALAAARGASGGAGVAFASMPPSIAGAPFSRALARARAPSSRALARAPPSNVLARSPSGRFLGYSGPATGTSAGPHATGRSLVSGKEPHPHDKIRYAFEKKPRGFVLTCVDDGSGSPPPPTGTRTRTAEFDDEEEQAESCVRRTLKEMLTSMADGKRILTRVAVSAIDPTPAGDPVGEAIGSTRNALTLVIAGKGGSHFKAVNGMTKPYETDDALVISFMEKLAFCLTKTEQRLQDVYAAGKTAFKMNASTPSSATT